MSSHLGFASGAADRSVPEGLRPAMPKELEIRVVMGLYDHLLTDSGRATFFETEWTLTPVADRVGFRYKGEKLDLVKRKQPFGAGSDPSNIVDSPYPIGSIQIPGGVEPIVLHRDAVSGGGYAMIATVISADMDTVAAVRAGVKDALCRSRARRRTGRADRTLEAAAGARDRAGLATSASSGRVAIACQSSIRRSITLRASPAMRASKSGISSSRPSDCWAATASAARRRRRSTRAPPDRD